MFTTTIEELKGILAAQIIAVVCAVSFDLLRGMKPKGRASVYEFFMWVALGGEFFCLWQKFLNGEHQIHLSIIFVITVILYVLTIENKVFMFFRFIREKICKFFDIILQFLLTSMAFLGKIMVCAREGIKTRCTFENEGNENEEKNQKKVGF